MSEIIERKVPQNGRVLTMSSVADAYTSRAIHTAYQSGFTWWGGALGPKLFNHHVCRACRYAFNRKTGRPNTTGIAVYVAVSIVLGLVLGYFVFSYLNAS